MNFILTSAKDGKIYHSNDALAPHSHEPIYSPGFFSRRAPLLPTRNFNELAFTIGGPVGTGKIALMPALCKFLRDIYSLAAIYEDEKSLCILDRNPLSRGHCLLIPKIHCCALDATPPSVIAAMCSKIPFISKAIMKATGCDSFNLLVNNGAAAGQVIFHTHIHIIPRKARDRLWASESLKRLTLKLDEESSQLAKTIREHISSVNNEEVDQRPP